MLVLLRLMFENNWCLASSKTHSSWKQSESSTQSLIVKRALYTLSSTANNFCIWKRTFKIGRVGVRKL